MNRYTLCAALLLYGVSAIRANVPDLPKPPRNPIQVGARHAEIVVEVVEKSKEARLQIPVGLLTAEKPRLGADAGRVPTLIAGLALTCAFVSGGFWLVRRGRSNTLATLLALSLLAAGASAVWADRAPPPRPKITPVTLPAQVEIPGKIVLEIVPTGDKIKLLVGPDMIKKSAEERKKD